MARRIRSTLFGRSFQRSIKAMTRATVRAGTRAASKAIKNALRPSPKVKKASVKAAKKIVKRVVTPRLSKSAATRPDTLAGPGTWSKGVAISPAGARRYLFYKPPLASAATRLPLLVMLHGCTQDAKSFARGTLMHRVAARDGFCVLWPEQDRLANVNGCWNWYETRSGRAFGEATSIIAAIDHASVRHKIDRSRVAVAGISAGASLAALLGMRHPERFKAVAMHSGIGPGAASSSSNVLGAMQGRRKPHVAVVAPTAELHATSLPPLLVIQGTADLVVRPSNGRDVAQAWADALGSRSTATRTVQRGKRYPMAVTDFKIKSRTVVSLCEVSHLGHAWSGGAAKQAFSDPKGPDASRMIWAFAQRQFSAGA
jgi:poly(hydroxyalkanoate) depolymerase family esterase